MKRKAKKRPGRPSAAGGRVKFTTTLPPETLADMNILTVEAGYSGMSQLIVQLVKAAMERRSVNQTAEYKKP